ncbi:hypothetical protein FQA39_LY06484 [Lamprigera yunnana]|nr:hypothetical protein FQA39_LY06484 [Lamprigera yunnana]
MRNQKPLKETEKKKDAENRENNAMLIEDKLFISGKEWKHDELVEIEVTEEEISKDTEEDIKTLREKTIEILRKTMEIQIQDNEIDLINRLGERKQDISRSIHKVLFDCFVISVIIATSAPTLTKKSRMNSPVSTNYKYSENGTFSDSEIEFSGSEDCRSKYSEYPRSECTSTNMSINHFQKGALVWAKYGKQWWSALILETPKDAALKKYNVFWLSDFTTSMIHEKNIIHFIQNFRETVKIWPKMSKLWKKGIWTALNELYDNRIDTKYENLTQFAEKNLNNIPHRKNIVPRWIDTILKNAKCNSDVDKTKTYHDETNIDESKNKIALRSLCLGCYTADCEKFDHPLFNGKICGKCLSRLKKTMFAMGDHDFCYYCAICGNAQNLQSCNNNLCGRGYCKECLTRFMGNTDCDLYIKKWICFLCVQSNSFLTKRIHHTIRIEKLHGKYNMVESAQKLKLTDNGLRVLSLYDGIGTGLYTLLRLSVPVEAYYASEVDQSAINIGKKSFGSEIHHIGDITNISEAFIESISPIHLVIGGLPLNDLNLVHPARNKTFDNKFVGILFFEFYRTINLVKKFNPQGFFWLYENSDRMELYSQERISRYLQQEPVCRNIALVSHQHIPRLFWGNLPTIQCNITENMINLQDVFMFDATTILPKINSDVYPPEQRKTRNYTATTKIHQQNDTIWLAKLEEAFGLPTHNGDRMSLTRQENLLEKAWSVNVYMHLFSALTC